MPAAPKQVIQTPQQATDNLHQAVGQNLQQMGRSSATVPTTSETPIPLTDELRQIGVDASHVIGTSFEELTQGTTHIRETKSKNWLKLLQEKVARIKIPGKLWK